MCIRDSERTSVYLAGDNQIYITDQDVINKLGVRADQVVDYKAIVGDTSDNIPGIKGVGEKTAITLLEKFDTLDAIYANLDQVENRWRGKFESNKDAAYMSRDLARIEVNLKIDLDLEHAAVKPFDSTVLEEFFKVMEFRTLLSKVPAISGSAPATEIVTQPRQVKAGEQMSMFVNAPQIVSFSQPSNINVVIVDSDEKLDALKKTLEKSKVISFDTETTSTEEVSAELVGISLAVKEGQG